MKYLLMLLSGFCLLSCNNNSGKEKKEKLLVQQQMPASPWEVSIDTTFVSGKDTFQLSYAMEPIPNSLLAWQEENEDSITLYFYKDYRLVSSLKKNNRLLSTDTLTKKLMEKDITREFLNEASIDKVRLYDFLPETATTTFVLQVNKPWEDFAYSYQYTVGGDSSFLEFLE